MAVSPRLRWRYWALLALIGVLAASSCVLVFGVEEAQAQGRGRALGAEVQPAAGSTEGGTAPAALGTAPRAEPASGAQPADATPQPTTRQAPTLGEDQSTGPPPTGGPRDGLGAHDRGLTSARAPTQQSSSTPPSTSESTADPSYVAEEPQQQAPPSGRGSTTPPREKPIKQEKPSEVGASKGEKPSKGEQVSEGKKPSEEGVSEEGRPSEEGVPEGEKPSKEEKPAKEERPAKEEKPSKPSDDELVSEEEKPAKDEELSKEEKPVMDEATSEEEKPSEDVTPSEDEEASEGETVLDLGQEEATPGHTSGPEGRGPTSAEELTDPAPEHSGRTESAEPASAEEPVLEPASDLPSGPTSEPSTDSSSDSPSVSPVTSTGSGATGPTSEAVESGPEAPATGPVPEQVDEPAPPTAGLSPSPGRDAGLTAEPGATTVAAEPVADPALEQILPTVEEPSEAAATDLTVGPAVPNSTPSTAMRFATGMTRFVNGVLETSYELVAGLIAWVDDLDSALAQAVDWLLGAGNEGLSPVNNPFAPLSGSEPVVPIPAAPIPFGGSAPASGASFGGSSSSGHAAKELFKEFGVLVSLLTILFGAGELRSTSREPHRPSSAQLQVLERPG